MDKEQPRLIILSAPSGGGKTTLCNLLRKEFPELAYSVSTTTRPKRPGETEGVHYHFVSDGEFQKKLAAGDFAEHAQVHNAWYATSKSEIARHLQAGHHILFDIDVQGAMSLKAIYPQRVLLIFVHPPSVEVLKARLIDRKGDSPASIETRLSNAYNELQWSHRFDYQITNEHLENAYKELKSIVKRECR